MISSSPLIFFPARPTVPFERLVQVLKDILVAAELEEYRSEGLITEQETLRLFLEQKEVRHVHQTHATVESGNHTY